ILDRQYHGVLQQMSLAAEPHEEWGQGQVEFSVKILITDPDQKLIPGMSAVMDIISFKKEKVLLLGHEFINREGEHYFVMSPQGQKIPIQVGQQNEEAFEILSGVQEGDLVQQIDFTQISNHKDS